MSNEVMSIVALDKNTQKWGEYKLVPITYRLEKTKEFEHVEDAVLSIRLTEIIKENELGPAPETNDLAFISQSAYSTQKHVKVIIEIKEEFRRDIPF